MKSSITKLIGMLTLSLTAATASYAQKTFDMDIWPNGMPNSNGIDLTKPFDDAKQNYKPSIRVFLPAKDKADGRAVVCCPGGGYAMVSLDHEGYGWAPFFNERGIALIVLKYRMPFGYSSVPATDADEAIRIVRRNAKAWNIDPEKVGIMGHSAGGHLASTVATHAVGNAHPDFQILLYPVITMDPGYTHMGSRENLIGKNPSAETQRFFSNELHVTSATPPALIILCNDDGTVPPENSINYYSALQHAGVSASMHIYPTGGHGFGVNKDFKFHDEMMSEISSWLKTLK